MSMQQNLFVCCEFEYYINYSIPFVDFIDLERHMLQPINRAPRYVAVIEVMDVAKFRDVIFMNLHCYSPFALYY